MPASTKPVNENDHTYIAEEVFRKALADYKMRALLKVKDEEEVCVLYVCVCMYVYVYVCMYVCIYVCVYVCMIFEVVLYVQTPLKKGN